MQNEYIYLLINLPGSVILDAWRSGELNNPYSYTPKVTTMTTKQIRDLQEFAVELAREGNTEAAKEVLALITNHG